MGDRGDRWIGLVIASMAVGCGRDGDVRPDAAPDSWPDGPNVVVVVAPGATHLRYRDGDGPWFEPRPLGDDAYELRVTTDYQVVIACGEAHDFRVRIVATTFAEHDDESASCRSTPPDEIVSVTGQMVQPGTIWMDERVTSPTGPWEFRLGVAPGVHDLIALSADRILIRRALDLTMDAALDPIDVDADVDGAGLVEVPLALADLTPQETIDAGVWVTTAHGGAWIEGEGAVVRIPPPATLTRSDVVALSVAADTPTTSRTVATVLTGDEPALTLMPILTGVSFFQRGGGVAVTWGELPAHTALYMVATDARGTESVFATRGWLDATGATTLGVPADLPGLSVGWRVDPTRRNLRSLHVLDDAEVVSRSTAIYQDTGGFARGDSNDRHRRSHHAGPRLTPTLERPDSTAHHGEHGWTLDRVRRARLTRSLR